MSKTSTDKTSITKNKTLIICLVIFLIISLSIVIISTNYNSYMNKTKVERLIQEFNITEYIENESNEIVYALDDKSNLYRYKAFTNDKGYDDLELTLEIENTGGIKQLYINGSETTLITNNNTLYSTYKSSYLSTMLENVKSFKHNGKNTYLILTNNGDLYGFGSNENGEIGDGNSSGTGKSTKVETPYLIMRNVKDYDSNSKNDYKSVALTHDGDLYVWGVNKLLLSEGMFFRNNYKLSSPTKILNNVKTFKSTTENLIATTNNNEEIIFDEDDRLSNELESKIYNSTNESFRIMYADMISSLGELSMVDFLNWPFVSGFKYYYEDKIEFDPFSNQPQKINFFNEKTNEEVFYIFDNYNGSIKLVTLGYSNGEGLATAIKKSPADKIQYIVTKVDGSSFEKNVSSISTQIELLFNLMHLFDSPFKSPS